LETRKTLVGNNGKYGMFLQQCFLICPGLNGVYSFTILVRFLT
jgi:hypothetical protein